jgi:hypothetical protein
MRKRLQSRCFQVIQQARPKIYQKENLTEAFRMVRANKGAPGIDGEIDAVDKTEAAHDRDEAMEDVQEDAQGNEGEGKRRNGKENGCA